MTNTPWGPVGLITFKRTYARRVREGSDRTESYEQTIERELKAIRQQLKLHWSEEDQTLYRHMRSQLKGSVSGRAMWQLGTRTVDQLGMMSLLNCAHAVVDEPVKPFVWAFDALMLGAGVGFNIQREYVYSLPKVGKVKLTHKNTKDARYIVPDSREGWVDLLERLLTLHFNGGGELEYSTVCVRAAGEPIKNFGGTASGPIPLIEGMQKINQLLNSRANKKIRSVDAMDIACIIGEIVVSGNVRRSSLIMLGDVDDMQFLDSKNWGKGNIPNYRAMANLTLVCSDINQLPQQYWDSFYDPNCEVFGLWNKHLVQTKDRLQDPEHEKNVTITGTNPCSEISLCNYETCNLATVFLCNVESFDRLKEYTRLLYQVTKAIVNMDCHSEDTEKICHTNNRIGIDASCGYLQATEEQRQWLPELYTWLKEYDKEYSKANNYPVSIALTTSKPSGTQALLPGVTPGWHPAFFPYYIRRIRMSSSDPLVELCRSHNYPVEFVRGFDGKQDKRTSVVSFPCATPEGVPVSADMSAIDKLEVIQRLQREWSDNSISATVEYEPNEVEALKQWLHANYNNSIKSVSFLQKQHGFIQAPYEEITKEQYEEMLKGITTISEEELTAGEDLDIQDCLGGSCPIK